MIEDQKPDCIVHSKMFLLEEDGFTDASVSFGIFNNGTYYKTELSIRDCNRSVRLHGAIDSNAGKNRELRKIDELISFIQEYRKRIFETIPDYPS
jgi:hypothetical protein